MHFTFVSCTWWLLGVCAGGSGECIGNLLVVHTWITFHLAPLLSGSCYEEMRLKNGWSVTLFWLGDTILHTLPAVYAVAFPVLYRPVHVLVSLIIYASWCVYEGTACHDRRYVPMSKHFWYASIALSAGVQALMLCGGEGA